MTCNSCSATFSTVDTKPSDNTTEEAVTLKTLANREKLKEIVSISRVDDNIIISFSNLTFLTTTADKVDKSVITKDSTVADLLARVEALEAKANKYNIIDLSEINAKLEALNAFDKSLVDNLVEAQNINGETTHKVVSKDYNPNKEN